MGMNVIEIVFDLVSKKQSVFLEHSEDHLNAAQWNGDRQHDWWPSTIVRGTSLEYLNVPDLRCT